MMAQQLAFDLPAVPALGREDFFVSPANTTALTLLEGWQSWPAHKMVLVGPRGAGKTHLAHVWAAQTGASIVAGRDLGGADIPALAAAPALVVEDADSPKLAQEALLHLHNLIISGGGALLLTAQTAPARWPLTLPDLKSRMEGTPTATLDLPDDALLQAVLVKLFADRQLTVQPNLLPYLLGRMDRSFAAAQALVARLDAAALAEGRAITRSFAGRVLDKPAGPRA